MWKPKQEILRKVKEMKGIKATDFQVYAILLGLKGNNAYAYPSHEYLANELLRGVTTIKVALKKLQAMGLIRIAKERNERTNRYFIVEHEFMKQAENTKSITFSRNFSNAVLSSPISYEFSPTTSPKQTFDQSVLAHNLKESFKNNINPLYPPKQESQKNTSSRGGLSFSSENKKEQEQEQEIREVQNRAVKKIEQLEEQKTKTIELNPEQQNTLAKLEKQFKDKGISPANKSFIKLFSSNELSNLLKKVENKYFETDLTTWLLRQPKAKQKE